MQIKKPSKLIAAAIALSLVAGDLAWAMPEMRPPTRPAAASELAADPHKVRVPYEFAMLQEVHAGTNGRLIVHIQDAHSNPGAQFNLASALERLMKDHGISLVLVEGGSRDVSLTPYKRLAPAAAWRQAARRFVSEGKMAGEEYLNLTSDLPMKLIGIEDRALYDEALSAYAGLAERRGHVLPYLSGVRSSVERLKGRL